MSERAFILLLLLSFFALLIPLGFIATNGDLDGEQNESEIAAKEDSEELQQQHTCKQVPASDLCTETQHQRFLEMCDLFAAFVEAARHVQLRYTLSDGTLLGYVRSGGIISHDQDLDVITFQDYYEAALPNMKAYNELENSYKWTLHPQWRLKPKDLLAQAGEDPASHRTRKEVGFMAPNARFGKRQGHGGLHVDVFPLFESNSDPDVLERFARTANWRLQSLPRSSMLPPIACTFIGLPTLCPPNPLPYLLGAFGISWNISEKICENGTWIRNPILG